MRHLIVLGMLLAAVPVMAIDASVETAFMNQYIWRGIVINDHMVMQPSLTFGSQGFELNLWGNMDLTDDYDHELELSEVDYTLSYSKELRSVDWTVGVVTYAFPHSDLASTTEAFVGATFTTVAFNPSVTVYYDLDEVDGYYVELAGSHDFACGLSAGLLVAYGSEDYIGAYFVNDGETDATFTHYAASLAYPVTLPVGELGFSLAYTDLIDSAIHSPGFENDDGNIVIGASWSYSF